MKLPRNVSGRSVAKALKKLGYETTRKTGSHIRLTTQEKGENHVTVPDVRQVPVGTLHQILSDVARHHGLSRSRLLDLLFG